MEEQKEQKEKLEKKLMELDKERVKIQEQLYKIKGRTLGNKIIHFICNSTEPLLCIFDEAETKELRNEVEQKGIIINESDLSYTFTVQRTARDGCDNIHWVPADDCDYCPNEDDSPPLIHDFITFNGRKLPEQVKVEYFCDLDFQDDEDDKLNDYLGEQWEHGSEFQRAHVTRDDLIGIAKKETWALIKQPRKKKKLKVVE